MLEIKFRKNQLRNIIILKFNLIKDKAKEKAKILLLNQYQNKNKNLYIKLYKIL